MRKPSESYAKELLGLSVTVPVSLFRAASRARCAGRAPDLFFGRPSAPGHDLPTQFFLRRCQEGQAMARHVSSSSSWIMRVGVARGTRRDRTVRAPRSRSRRSRRPHLSACAESVGGYAGRDAQAERELHAKELLGLGVTVPVSFFGDEHAAAEGPHDHEPGVSQC